MKKVTYLLLVMFAVVLMSTSCEKDETITPKNENQITEEMLLGYWDWVSFDFNGNTYDICNDDLYFIYDWTTLNLTFNELRADMNSKCAWGEDEFDVTSATYEIDGNLLKIAGNAYVFEILSTYQEVENGTLKLKWIEGYNSRLPIGGIHTLVNQ